MVSNHWVLFNSFVLIWFVVIFPIFVAFEREIGTVVTFGVFIILIPLSNIMFDFAEISPKTFLKIENMNVFFSKIFWRFIYLPEILLFSLFVVFLSKLVVVSNEVASVFVLVFIGFTSFFIGATFYAIFWIGNVGIQPRTLKERAKVSFMVLSDSLKYPVQKKNGKLTIFIRAFFTRRTVIDEEKKKQINLFESGLNNLNKLFINLYNFEFCNLKKYCDYFRFMLWLEDSSEINRIRKVIDALGCELRKPVILSDIMWTTRQILMEKQLIPKEELFQELDFKTGINRWYYHNKEVVNLSLLILPLVLSIIA